MRLSIDGGLGMAIHAETRYRAECWRAGAGLVWAEDFHNLVTGFGLEHMVRRVIAGQTLPTMAASGTLANNGRGYPDGRRIPRVWTASTLVVVGDLVIPTAPGANGRMYLCTTGGTTHTVAPTFPTTAGGQVTEASGVVWTEASLWYVGLKAAGGISGTDTMGIRSWAEVTSYSETGRQPFLPAAPTSGSVNNGASRAAFTMTAALTLYGAFLVDNPSKAGTNGLLYGVGDFSTPRVVAINDIVSVTGTVTVTS